MRAPVLALVALASLTLAQSAAADPVATGPSGTQAFGDAQIGVATAPASRSYTVRNTGIDPVAVLSSTLSGADAAQFELSGTCAARGTANPLAAGETCTVIVAFHPTTTGAKSTTLTTTTNGPAFTTGAITGTGRHLVATPASGDFGDQHVGTTSAPQTITITNDADEAYPLGAVATSVTSFLKGTDTCAATTLAAHASCTVAVAFAPTTGGVKTGYVTIANHKPHLIPLAGTGVEPATALSPATHAFGDTAAGSSTAPATFTLKNTGNEPLHVGAARLSDSSFGLYKDKCSGTTVAPSATCTVAVAFHAFDAGWRAAALTLPVAGLPDVTARVSARGTDTTNNANVLDDDPFALPTDLASLPLARLTGDGGDNLGAAITGTPAGCDVNGDGYSDVLTGASLWSVSPADQSWEGAAYVTFGGPDFGSQDLAATTAGRTIRIEGEKALAQTGTSVACAGDVNGDGIDDVVIGAWAYQYDGRAAGTAAPRGDAYVVFGARDLPQAGPLDLGLLGSRGYKIVAPEDVRYDHLGYQVTGVGDVDGDGRDDLALMSNTADSPDVTPARTSNGRTYLVRGQAGTGVQDIATAGNTLATIIGASPFTTASPWGLMGTIAPLGDVDGDGTPDLGIGVYTATALGRTTASGAAYVVSGRKRGTIDLADQSSSLFAVAGAFAGHRLGIGIAGLGDVNGDGLADVGIGADSTAAANSDAAYVVYGARDDAPGTLLDTAALGDRGYRILGAPGSSAGYALAPAGDVDGDGRADVVVGAYGAGTGGIAYLVRGVADLGALPKNNDGGGSAIVPANTADSTRYVALARLTPAQGSALAGQTYGERFGRQVANVGDVNGDGRADLAIGADMALRYGRTRAGEVTIALTPGKVPALARTPPADDGPTDDRPTDDRPAETTGDRTTTTTTTVTTTVTTPAPPPAPAPAVQGASKVAPIPTLAARALKVDGKGRVALTVRCARATTTCAGRLTFAVAGVKRTLAFSVAPGRTTTVRVTLSASQRKAIRKHRRLSGRVAFAVSGAAARTLDVTVAVAK